MIFPKTGCHFSGSCFRLRRDECDCVEGESAMTRNNVLYLVIGALAVAAAVLGYQVYQDRHKPQGVHIDVGPGGLKIEGK
jgi:hypothetical protein